MSDVIFQDLGLTDYKRAWDYQEMLFNDTLEQKLRNRDLPAEQQVLPPNHLIFCEHPHVITLGKSGDAQHLLMSESFLKEKGIAFYRINRGGDITYHGPDQLVGYPILDLDQFVTDIDKYLRLLEEMIIRTLADYGIKGKRLKGATGVWLDPDNPAKARKICAMGIRCSRWVTMHGFALNVNNDLSYFNFIVPCGINNKQVTSMQKELGKKVNKEEVKSRLKHHFSNLFDASLTTKSGQHTLNKAG